MVCLYLSIIRMYKIYAGQLTRDKKTGILLLIYPFAKAAHKLPGQKFVIVKWLYNRYETYCTRLLPAI